MAARGVLHHLTVHTQLHLVVLVCSDVSVAVFYLVRPLFGPFCVNISANTNSVRTNYMSLVVVVSGNTNRVGALVFLPAQWAARY